MRNTDIHALKKKNRHSREISQRERGMNWTCIHTPTSGSDSSSNSSPPSSFTTTVSLYVLYLYTVYHIRTLTHTHLPMQMLWEVILSTRIFKNAFTTSSISFAPHAWMYVFYYCSSSSFLLFCSILFYFCFFFTFFSLFLRVCCFSLFTHFPCKCSELK